MMLITPVKKSVVTNVTITMTVEEASYLLEIIQHIGGPPEGPRGTFDRLGSGLERAEVERSHGLYSKQVTGGITIEPVKEEA